MTPLDFVASTDTSFQNAGAAHYFHELTKPAADNIGLDLFRFYFCGRGGVLGPVSSSVVQSAFGLFNPELLHKMWTTGAERCDVEVAAATQMQVAYDIGERDLGDVVGMADATASLAQLTSSVDVGGLGLFAGFQQLAAPAGEAAAWMHQVILMRELRGAVHLAALAAHGVPGRVAHQIKRPNDGEMFGWTEPVEITNAQQRGYKEATALTNTGMASHCAILTDDERAHVAAVAGATTDHISAV